LLSFRLKSFQRQNTGRGAAFPALSPAHRGLRFIDFGGATASTTLCVTIDPRLDPVAAKRRARHRVIALFVAVVTRHNLFSLDVLAAKVGSFVVGTFLLLHVHIKTPFQAVLEGDLVMVAIVAQVSEQIPDCGFGRRLSGRPVFVNRRF
jgi:hypothetical protein